VSTVLVAFGASPQRWTKPSQGLTVKIKTVPELPVVGIVEIPLDILEEIGQPMDGAMVDINVYYIDMTGMLMGGLTTLQDNGRYAITADCIMPGNWKITEYVRNVSVNETQEFGLVIQ